MPSASAYGEEAGFGLALSYPFCKSIANLGQSYPRGRASINIQNIVFCCPTWLEKPLTTFRQTLIELEYSKT
jgi:hypothetical protein